MFKINSKTNTIPKIVKGSFKLALNKKNILGKSLLFFSKNNSLRKFAVLLTENKYFNLFMLLQVIFSFLILALRDPLMSPFTKRNWSLFQLEIAVYFIFCLEFILNIISNGFLLNGWDSYMISPINVLNFVLLISEPIYLLKKESFPWKVLRLLRFFVSGPASYSLSLILKTTLVSIPNLLKLASIYIIIVTVFGAFAKNYLKSAMYFCTSIDNSILEFVKTNTDCLDYGGDWLPRDLNFDNLLNTLKTLLFVSGSENWIPIL